MCIRDRSGLIPIRQRIVDAREAFDLPDGGRYMTFTADGAEGRRPRGTFYYVCLLYTSRCV